MSDRTWKAVERRIAAFFGSRRVPGSGALWREYETRSDSDHERLYIETKHRQRFAVLTLWRDTQEKARKEGKRPVVALAEKGRKGFWVLVHSADLAAVADEISDTPDSGEGQSAVIEEDTQTDCQPRELEKGSFNAGGSE